MLSRFRAFLIGKPLATHQVPHERLSNPQGLAIFASDNLSSTAYATEEILLVLVLAGTAAFVYSIPIAVIITLLVSVVVFSYRQLIHAYPRGGGAYHVAKDNLGETTALTAAAAILIDYVLTAAVSISAGVAAATSAFPSLYPWRVWLAVLAVAFLVWGNLRGVRESGRLFAMPTYFFILSLFGLIGYGAWRYFSGTFPAAASPAPGVLPAFGSVTLFLLLRAFSAGCTALTGIEATSNGVQSFRPPESKNAANTLTAMAIVLGIIFLGITLLGYALHIAPKAEETVVSQIAAGMFGRTFPYFLVQIATALILLLAANTPFAAFPRLGSVLAKDKFFPHQFMHLGSRLVYSSGISILALVAALLLIFFGADTHRLIPLYAIGVFIVFTISQFGMVRHWKQRHPHGRHLFNIAVNTVGGSITLVVLLIIFISKFKSGAWMLVPATLFLVLFMRAIRAHYRSVAEQLSLKNPSPKIPREKTVAILVSGVHQGTLKAIEVARALRPAHLKAVHIALDDAEAETVKKKWKQHVEGIHLDIIPSPYRDLTGLLIQYIERIERRWENDTVIVVLPEFVPTKFWHHFLHNQTATQIRWALEHREDVEILDVPYRLKDKQVGMRGILQSIIVESIKAFLTGAIGAMVWVIKTAYRGLEYLAISIQNAIARVMKIKK